MKSLLSVVGLIVALAVVAYAEEKQQHGNFHILPHPNPSYPNFPGHGPFNPKAKPLPYLPHRFRRDNGQLHAHTNLMHGRPVSSSLDYEKKIFENNHGSVMAYGGANHQTGMRMPEAHGGVRGIFSFGGKGRPMSQDERLFNQVMNQNRRH